MTTPPENKTRPLLSVVVPAYNEEERLPETIRIIEDFLRQQKWPSELIVVDDGSRDRTVQVANKSFSSPTSRVEKNPRNMGKGATIRNGMTRHAKGKYRLFTDADNSTPIEETTKLLRQLRRRGADIAIGSRALPGSKLEVRQPFYREIMGRIFNGFVRILAVRGIHDTQCGFKLFTAKAAEAIFPLQKLDGFSFDVEVLHIARRKGFKIVEVPVRWINSPASRVNPIRDSMGMFVDLVRIRVRRYE